MCKNYLCFRLAILCFFHPSFHRPFLFTTKLIFLWDAILPDTSCDTTGISVRTTFTFKVQYLCIYFLHLWWFLFRKYIFFKVERFNLVSSFLTTTANLILAVRRFVPFDNCLSDTIPVNLTLNLLIYFITIYSIFWTGTNFKHIITLRIAYPVFPYLTPHTNYILIFKFIC